MNNQIFPLLIKLCSIILIYGAIYIKRGNNGKFFSFYTFKIILTITIGLILYNLAEHL
jgi:hypothetical protein